MSFKQGDPMWVDLGTDQLEESKKFYSALFGWEFTDTGADFGHYNIITLNGNRIGGAMNSLIGPEGPREKAETPNAWGVYLKVENIEESVSAAQEAGASVIVSPMAVGDLGKMAFIADGAGAAVGLWEYGAGFEGSVVNNGAGTAAWFEALSTDLDAALPTYRALGWEIGWMGGEDAPVRFATNTADESKATAGLCDASSFLPEGTPSFWRPYFLVEDTDAAIKRIQELGGLVSDGPMDSPYGRIATVAGPDGAHFQIVNVLQNS